MSPTISHTTELVVVTCWCGMPHAVPSELRNHQQRAHRDGRKQKDIYCPLGHTYVIAGEGEAAELRRQLERQRDRSARLAAERDQAEASRKAHKAAATRARHERDRIGQRAKAGLCPCCNRTFKQLARHMASKHPDYDPEEHR